MKGRRDGESGMEAGWRQEMSECMTEVCTMESRFQCRMKTDDEIKGDTMLGGVGGESLYYLNNVCR